MKKILKSLKSKTAFTLCLTPKIEKSYQNYRKFIPEPYQAVLIISADFELAWAWQYSKNLLMPIKEALSFARRARKNIPEILSLCEKYDIPITWATVGHLFLEECKKENGKPHPDIKRLSYFENRYWKFHKGDWFDNDPCTNWEESPEWYAPDLIQEILNKKVKHEIGCHTFSHIDCSDAICSNEVFQSEINACKQEAKKYNIELKTFVHPGHTVGNLNNLAKMGFTSFRTNNRNVLGYPVKHQNGLWEFEQTAEFVYRPQWSIEYHIYRYKKIIDRAIKSNTLCYFWFHPSVDNIFVQKIMPQIFRYLDSKRDDILIITNGEYISDLNKGYNE